MEPFDNQELEHLVRACRNASRAIAKADTGSKNALLLRIADLLLEHTAAIVSANDEDVRAARSKGLSDAMVDRLILDPKRLKALADSVREVAALPDPVGEITSGWLRPNGLQVSKQRIPLGVIAMIYESRPNVTIDAAVLCLKAGNGIILRGGSEAFHSNSALAALLRQAFIEARLPEHIAVLVPTTERAAMNQLLLFDQYIDLVIPRGGEGLIRFVTEHSRIPVIKHYKGVCTLFVDASANHDMAIGLLLDGKASRPGVCNALENMLVHQDIAASFLPAAAAALAGKAVTVKACPVAQALMPGAQLADEEDYAAEFLDLVIAVKVVAGLDEAIGFIQTYGSDHTEVICTNQFDNAQRFVREVPSSVVMVNASSRFSDGGQLGLGSEIGISTSRLHAYGPMGLSALTSEKFVVLGAGQTRHPL